MRFVPLTIELLRWAMVIAGDPVVRDLADKAPELYERMLSGPGIGEAMLEGGHLLGAGGITQHWIGRAEAWLMMSPDANRRQRLAALRRCQTKIATLQRDPGFRRIEMYVLADAPWGERFSSLMGFSQEGVARAWDPLGRDHHLFARIADPV